MRFFILNQYYPPDVAPTGQVAQDLARYLVTKGHSVTIFCSRVDEGQVSHGQDVEVRRCAATRLGKGMFSKLMHYASFYGVLAFRLCLAKPKPDVIMAMTTPPYLGLLACLVARLRRCRSVDWVMDVYPDVISAHGTISESSWTMRFLRCLNRFYLSRSHLVLTLGPDMAERLSGYQGGGKSAWVPLWAGRKGDVRDSEIQVYRERQGWTQKEVVFLYSGNLGLGHRFGEFLQVIGERGEVSPARWVFCGRGGRRGEIERFVAEHGEFPVDLWDYVEAESLAVHLAAADVHLVSLDPSWDGCMLPSKFQASFAAARPVVLVASEGNSLGRWMRESGGGWLVAPGDVRGLHRAVEEALDSAERVRRGHLGRAFAKENFDRDLNCAQIFARIAEI